MKLKTKLIFGSSLIVGVSCFLLVHVHVKNSIEQVVETALDEPLMIGDRPPQKRLNPEFNRFLGWYQPMVKDARPDVRAVMIKFDPKYRKGRTHRNKELEQQIPTDEWIQRLLDMGVVIDDYSDYSAYLSARWRLFHAKNNPEELYELKARHKLAVSASWDEVVDAQIKESVKLHTKTEQAIAADPRVRGGNLDKDGVFVPFRHKTVYVRPGALTASGVPRWVVHEISKREQGYPPSREIPDDIDIIYLDEKGQSIKDRVPPNGGVRDEIEGNSSSETDTTFDSASEQSPLADDFDNSFPEDLPPSDTEPPQFEKPNFPQSVADLEKQFSLEGIEEELSEGLSPERFDKAQQLIDQFGTEEGLRQLRESDPEAARQFERERLRPESPRPSEPSRDAPESEQ